MACTYRELQKCNETYYNTIIELQAKNKMIVSEVEKMRAKLRDRESDLKDCHDRWGICRREKDALDAERFKAKLDADYQKEESQ